MRACLVPEQATAVSPAGAKNLLQIPNFPLPRPLGTVDTRVGNGEPLRELGRLPSRREEWSRLRF